MSNNKKNDVENFKLNTYIELYNPAKSNYFPVRILEKSENGYKTVILEKNKEINIYDYQLRTYGYRYIRINEKILNELGFEKDGPKYELDDLLVIEVLIGDLNKIDYPFHLFEFSTKHLGFAILKKDELQAFQLDYKKIDFNEKEHLIRKKYTFSSDINDVFSKLAKNKPNEFDYEFFDKIIVQNK